MTKRDFFRIIIKIFGLYSLILTLFNVLPTSIGYITDFAPTTLLWIFGALVLIVLMFAFLIFNTDKIINLLMGYLILTNHNRIADWVVRKEKNVG